jgi:hypothetical protein
MEYQNALKRCFLIPSDARRLTKANENHFRRTEKNLCMGSKNSLDTAGS